MSYVVAIERRAPAAALTYDESMRVVDVSLTPCAPRAVRWCESVFLVRLPLLVGRLSRGTR